MYGIDGLSKQGLGFSPLFFIFFIFKLQKSDYFILLLTLEKLIGQTIL